MVLVSSIASRYHLGGQLFMAMLRPRGRLTCACDEWGMGVGEGGGCELRLFSYGIKHRHARLQDNVDGQCA